MSKFDDVIVSKYKQILKEDANVPPPNVVNDAPDQQEQPTAPNKQTPPPTNDIPVEKPEKNEIDNNNIAFFTKSMINAILNADKITDENKAKLSEIEGKITAENAYQTLTMIIGMTSEENPDEFPKDGTST